MIPTPATQHDVPARRIGAVFGRIVLAVVALMALAALEPRLLAGVPDQLAAIGRYVHGFAVAARAWWST